MLRIKFFAHEWQLFMKVSTLDHNLETLDTAFSHISFYPNFFKEIHLIGTRFAAIVV